MHRAFVAILTPYPPLCGYRSYKFYLLQELEHDGLSQFPSDFRYDGLKSLPTCIHSLALRFEPCRMGGSSGRIFSNRSDTSRAGSERWMDCGVDTADSEMTKME